MFSEQICGTFSKRAGLREPEGCKSKRGKRPLKGSV